MSIERQACNRVKQRSLVNGHNDHAASNGRAKASAATATRRCHAADVALLPTPSPPPSACCSASRIAALLPPELHARQAGSTCSSM
jgi:hypothetical protein